MSWYLKIRNNFGRCDSVQGLPPHDHETISRDWDGSQAISASSVVHSPGPWSSLNTRHGSGPFHPYANAEWPPDSDIFDDPAYLGYNTDTFQPDVSTPNPDARVRSSATESLGGHHSPALAASALIPWATTSNGPPVYTLSTNQDTDANTSSCPHCDRRFTGAHQRSNLRRHLRHKHTGANCGALTCTAEGCPKIFQRQDARLKHAQKKHPELFPPPQSVPRRQDTERLSTPQAYTPADPDQNLNYVGHWLQAEPGLTNSHVLSAQHLVGPSAVTEELPRAAKSVFETLQMKLDQVTYSRVCGSFFSRWESVIQKLKDDGSSAYPVYATALEEIRTVAYARDFSQSNFYQVTPGGSHSRAGRKGRTGPRGGITSPIDRISKRFDHKQSLGSSSGQNAVAMGERSFKGPKQTVDCPVYKHHIMHGQVRPCNGCKETVMSQVRNHVNPNRTTHGGFPAFLGRCPRCQKDFIDQHLFNNHKDISGCVYQPQTRGNIVKSWVQLYLTLYPEARRVPLPWCDEQGWLSASEVAPYLPSRADQTVPSPFLGQPRVRSNIQPTIPHSATSSYEQPVHDAALRHMLHDIVNPAVIQPSPSSTPIYNRHRMSPAGLQASSLGWSGGNTEHWQNVLLSFESHQRALRQAAPYLLPDQLSFLASESELISNLSRNMYHQQSQTQMGHVNIQAQHAPSNYDPPPPPPPFPQIADPVYTTPISALNALHLDQGSYGTPSFGTQPSTQGYDTGSSLHQSSILTEPSSTHDPFGSRLLSPASPTCHRGTSLPPGQDQDGPRLRSVKHSGRSLQDEFSSDDDDDKRGDVSRRLFERDMNQY